MHAFDAARAGARLADAWRSGEGIASAAVAPPEDVPAAYAAQRAMLTALMPGKRFDTWKISPRRPDAAPTAAPIPPGRRLSSPADVREVPGRLLGIEAEIAFRFGRDLPPRREPYADATVRDAVDAALVAIELCATRLADWEQAAPLWRLADLQSTACLVVGEPWRDWRSLDFAQLEAVVTVDGAEKMRRRGAHPNLDPSVLLSDLVAHACAEGDGIRAGDIVTTGSWIGMLAVEAPATIDVRFKGVGDARLRLLR
jgi:2-keto-4-pentenoate hydratase